MVFKILWPKKKGYTYVKSNDIKFLLKKKKKEKEKRIDFKLSKSWNYKYIYIYIYIWIWYKHLLEVECKKEHINGQFCCTVQSKIKKEYRIYLFDCKGKISK